MDRPDTVQACMVGDMVGRTIQRLIKWGEGLESVIAELEEKIKVLESEGRGYENENRPSKC